MTHDRLDLKKIQFPKKEAKTPTKNGLPGSRPSSPEWEVVRGASHRPGRMLVLLWGCYRGQSGMRVLAWGSRWLEGLGIAGRDGEMWMLTQKSVLPDGSGRLPPPDPDLGVANTGLQGRDARVLLIPRAGPTSLWTHIFLSLPGPCELGQWRHAPLT